MQSPSPAIRRIGRRWSPFPLALSQTPVYTARPRIQSCLRPSFRWYFVLICAYTHRRMARLSYHTAINVTHRRTPSTEARRLLAHCALQCTTGRGPPSQHFLCRTGGLAVPLRCQLYICCCHQGRIKAKLDLMLLPRKGSIFFLASKTVGTLQSASHGNILTCVVVYVQNPEPLACDETT